jgi:hypothetical protein
LYWIGRTCASLHPVCDPAPRAPALLLSEMCVATGTPSSPTGSSTPPRTTSACASCSSSSSCCAAGINTILWLTPTQGTSLRAIAASGVSRTSSFLILSAWLRCAPQLIDHGLLVFCQVSCLSFVLPGVRRSRRRFVPGGWWQDVASRPEAFPGWCVCSIVRPSRSLTSPCSLIEFVPPLCRRILSSPSLAHFAMHVGQATRPHSSASFPLSAVSRRIASRASVWRRRA